ncbi:MAG: dUTP diphosphatase [Mycoplasmoidaceae bacterium]|nr:MAG: dUTP diphosphatase [Mycoplasmoidaceae bacterium]
MKVDFSDIVAQQEELDKEIMSKHNTSYKKTFLERKLATLVELGELANEIKSFKYWSIKGPSDKSVILEEYADGLHFISGFFVQYKKEMKPLFVLSDKINQILDKKNINTRLINIYNLILKLNPSSDDTPSTLKNLYKSYLELGLNLGYNIEEIKIGYKSKHEINHTRQNNNY